MSQPSFSRWPLRRQLIVALGGTLLVTGIVSSQLVRKLESAYLEQVFHQQSQRTFSVLSAASLDAVVSEDRPVLETIVAQSVSFEPDIFSLTVYNELGEPLVTWRMENPSPTAELREFSSDVVFEGESFGRIDIEWDVQSLLQEIDAHVGKMSLFTGGALLLLGLILLAWVNRLVVSPIKRIHGRLVELQRDEIGATLELNAAEELTRLSDSVNALGDVLELRQKREAELEEASRAKSSFLANMSHELRTPMNGVLGMLSLISKTEMNRQQLEWVNIATRSSKTLLALINNVLDFSKIEASKLELESIDLDVRGIVEDCMELVAGQAQSKNVELSCIASPDVPRVIRGDPTRLRQVLTNLLGNAVKFTDAGEVTVTVETIGDGDERALRFAVTDSGVGIAEEVLEHVFDLFTQADGSTTRRYGGSGLGLAICRQLVELMGGEIGATSEPGVGSTFSFTMRLVESSSNGEHFDPADALAGKRALVADDTPAVQRSMRLLLESWGASCTLVESQAAAVAKLREAAERGAPFDVALIDVVGPEGRDDELVDELQAGLVSPETPVIKLTSFFHQAVDGSASERLVSHVRKPLRESGLRRQVYVALGMEAPSDPMAVADLPGTREAQLERRRRKRILVVEDNEVNQAVVVSMLDTLEYPAEIAHNGLDALDRLETETFDLVLMDCQMPGLDGYETTRRLRQRENGDSRLPIIALTANALTGDAEKCFEAGMDDYLSKPFEAEALEYKIDHWVLGSGAEPRVPVPQGQEQHGAVRAAGSAV